VNDHDEIIWCILALVGERGREYRASRTVETYRALRSATVILREWTERRACTTT
jgi:flagellar biosynthesis/type III secretory pathway ATPase